MIDGIRTRDTRDHNPVLYQLSYDHHADTEITSVGGLIIIPASGAGPSSGFGAAE